MSSSRFEVEAWWDDLTAGKQRDIEACIETLCSQKELKLPIEEVFTTSQVQEAVGRAYRGGCTGRVLIELDSESTEAPTVYANEKTATGHCGAIGCAPLDSVQQVAHAAYRAHREEARRARGGT